MSFEKNLHYEANETDRRGSQSVLLAKVMEVDTAKARMRVQAGSLQSAWVPFASSRAGPDSSWHPPEPGEQVILACPGGDTNQAVCLGSVYQQDYPAPADSADVSKTKWKDGAEQSYDRAGHNWNLNVPSGGNITLRCGGSVLTISDSGITWESTGTVSIRAQRIELN